MKVGNVNMTQYEYLEKFTNYENINISMETIDKDKTITKVCDNVIVIVPLKALVNVEEEL